MAELEIVSVTTAPFERNSYDGPPEVIMNFQIRNVSGQTIYLWGQKFGMTNDFYLIESFIQNSANAVWEKYNIGMCDSVGRTGWIEVKPDDAIRQHNVIFHKYVGQQMIFTLRRAYSEGDDKGADILLGPFRIPEPYKSEQAVPAYGAQGAPSAEP